MLLSCPDLSNNRLPVRIHLRCYSKPSGMQLRRSFGEKRNRRSVEVEGRKGANNDGDRWSHLYVSRALIITSQYDTCFRWDTIGGEPVYDSSPMCLNFGHERIPEMVEVLEEAGRGPSPIEQRSAANNFKAVVCMKLKGNGNRWWWYYILCSTCISKCYLVLIIIISV